MASKSDKKTAVGERVLVTGRLERSLEEVDRLLAADKSDIVLDMSGCPFVTVEGLEWLEELLMRADSKKHDVSIVGIQPTVYKVFKVSHIDRILKACGAPTGATGPTC